MLAVLVASCHSTPSWSTATEAERRTGRFKADADYLASPQFDASIKQSVDTVERLRLQKRQ